MIEIKIEIEEELKRIKGAKKRIEKKFQDKYEGEEWEKVIQEIKSLPFPLSSELYKIKRFSYF